MAFWKFVLKFDAEDQGWTETLFCQTDTIDGAISFARTTATFRLQNLDETKTLTAFSVTEEGIPRPRIGLEVDFDREGLLVVDKDNPVEVSAVAGLYLFRFSDNTSRPYFLRGVRKTDYIRQFPSGIALRTADKIKADAAYLGNLISSPAARGRHFTLPTVGGGPPIPMTQVAAASGTTNPGALTMTVGDSTQFINFPYARFKGVPRNILPWLKGIWLVSVRDGTHITVSLPDRAPKPPDAITADRWFVGGLAYSYPTITDWGFRDMRTRQTGRPTTRIAGKSSGVKYRR